MNQIEINNIKIELKGWAGTEIKHENTIIGIDITENTWKYQYLLYTHNHPKHTPKTINENEKNKIFSPFTGKIVKSGDKIKLDRNIEIEVVEAYNRINKPHQKGFGVGYIVKIEETNIYHMGDTDLIDEITKIENEITILLTPIGGETVMNPEEACEAVKSIKPSITIPIHYQNINQYYKFRDITKLYTQIIMLRR